MWPPANILPEWVFWSSATFTQYCTQCTHRPVALTPPHTMLKVSLINGTVDPRAKQQTCFETRLKRNVEYQLLFWETFMPRSLYVAKFLPFRVLLHTIRVWSWSQFTERFCFFALRMINTDFRATSYPLPPVNISWAEHKIIAEDLFSTPPMWTQSSLFCYLIVKLSLGKV